MRSLLILTLAVLLMLPASSSLADWDPEMPSKWVQYPDLDLTGIDINASSVPGDYILADDFLCTEKGYITGIHIWGSWLHDFLPLGDPGNIMFTLSIHADIPASQNPEGYSMPGELLWLMEFDLGQFIVRPYAENIAEGWMDPPEGYMPPPADTICWQYNFHIDEQQAFFQEGTPDNPIVYWLDLKAYPMGQGEAMFGWKTSLDNWNDNAVWSQGMDPPTQQWRELIYPPGHEMADRPIDLAFVLTGDDHPAELDFGDAPDPSFPTLLASNGARHQVGAMCMGLMVDGEPDGQPSAAALGDDNDGNDDEDGCTFGPMVPGQPANLNVFVTSPVQGMIDAWIDFNLNGTWADANEQICISAPVVPGANTLTFNVPASAFPGSQTFARVRLSSMGGLSYDGVYPTGLVPDGEVEDYLVILEEQELFDFGDAPDPTYPTLAANNGPYHILSQLYMGASVDGEPDGQPTVSALGDDNDGNDDEDGVVFSVLKAGQLSSIVVTASAPGMVDAWIDFDGDGTWMQADENIVISQPANPGPNTFTFTVPATAASPGNTYARIRLSSNGGLSFDGPYPDGVFPDGEVEDYEVFIEDRYVFKWIQHPDLSTMGIDVNATEWDQFVLADDFNCTLTGPLTDFHIWSSWLNDYLPYGEDPRAVKFTLSIHKDIPADEATGEYSRPGELLWMHTFEPHSYKAEPFAEDIEEGWMDPPAMYTFPADWTCWIYKFHVDPHLAFVQEGTEDRPIVYWLDVQAMPEDPEAKWGWKTSIDHWNDNAVYGVGMEPYPGPWMELYYPPNHEMAGMQIDLAFALYSDLVTAVPIPPQKLGLLYNSPNPFNPMTRIHFSIPNGGADIRLEVFDARGRRVNTLIDGFVEGDEHSATWTGKDDHGAPVPSGVYFYRLSGSGVDQSLKMLLVR
ncbi:MAG: hypothetical protein KOO60_02025 [Gemmatimonadales bacterium]|nr:hypothetical protein [Gemmatimonadales bacterium]